MRTFHCQACGNSVYFENTVCTHCGHVLGVLPGLGTISALEPAGTGLWRPLAPEAAGQLHRQCANYAEHQVCNWMVPADAARALCDACRFNTTIPNLDRPENLVRWGRMERAKRRLIYGLMRLGLPLIDKQAHPGQGLAFAFPSGREADPGEAVRTGHAGGLITINLDEADPAFREQARVSMGERYRTLLGHFRHEIGHYYWDLLIRDAGRLAEPGSDAAAAAAPRLTGFRALFGDERADYAEALATHHAEGPPADWQGRFISPYASAHPWEDWAETFAHYLHIVDALETAAHFGIEMEHALPDGSLRRADPAFDPCTVDDFAPILEHWVPLTFALNSLNRSMGLPDLYPFVISPSVADKLAHVHGVVRSARGSCSLS